MVAGRAGWRPGRPTSMRVIKHDKAITCPWCNAGATMTFQDHSGEYCMACKKDLKTGKPMIR